MRATTRDIGFAIRDFLEAQTISNFADDPDHECELVENESAHHIAFVDVSDVHNPLIHLEDGQKFRVRIFAED
jgi:hypothetical protein